MERYTDELLENPAIQLLATITKTELTGAHPSGIDYSYYLNKLIPYSTVVSKSDVTFSNDCGLLNMNPWELGHLLTAAYRKYKAQVIAENYTEYFNYLATFRTGHAYFRGGIVHSNYEENYQINGNYFEIDGSKLDYATIYSTRDLSSIEEYKIPDVQSSMFAYAIHSNAKDFNSAMGSDYEMAWNEAYLQSKATLHINNIVITGNTGTTHTENEDLTNNAVAMMNRDSGGISGVSGYFGANININNAIIRGTTLGVAVRFESGLVLDNTYILSCWADSVFGLDANDVYITNCYIKDSGGPALYFEDTESNFNETVPVTDNVVQIDKNTRIENYVVGSEGYYVGYGMSASVLLLKGMMEQDIEKQGYKSVINENNYLGLPTDMINFGIMLVTGGGNYGKNKDNAVCNIKLVITDSNNIVATHSVPDYPDTGAIGTKDQFIELNEDSINDAYYALSYAVPGKGKSVLVLGANKK